MKSPQLITLCCFPRIMMNGLNPWNTLGKHAKNLVSFI
ncbi:hypothetical protein V6Z12_D03G084900 [Gossypium hirsutum]